MSPSESPAPTGGSLAEIKAIAEELLDRVSGPTMADNLYLFPYGINSVNVRVKSGENEISLEVSGPDHAHADELDEEEDYEPDWFTSDLDDELDEDEDEEDRGP